MGGDHGPDVVIEGVKAALHSGDPISQIHLVGDEAQIQTAITKKLLRDERITIVHAPDVLTMDDKPLDVLRKKKNCSMAKAIELLKEGQGEVAISCGNTGGLVAAATVKLRPLANVERPAIAAVVPTPDSFFLLLDAGANADCKPLHLGQFALMGNVYSREILGNPRPRVGILSNGKEDTKGNDLTRDALDLCRQLDLNCIGYVEGHDLFAEHVDVVVTDGFVGNIVLKTCEGMGKAIRVMLKSELTRNPLRKFGAVLACGGLQSIQRRMNADNYGGAPLLGLNGTVIKAHGSATALAIRNAIRVGLETIQHHLAETISSDIARADERLASTRAAVHTVPS